MKNTVELFSMIHDNGEWANGVKNGDVHAEHLTASAVAQRKRMLDGLFIGDRFRFESMGLFSSKRIRYTVNSMSQAEIDAGGDNDPFEQVETIYTPMH